MADETTTRNVGFARKQLEKHGWCEGKGLGKEESGISKAIKVNIKTDAAGVGYDAGAQFSFHWWDHVFNKTAKSIVVQESEEGVEVVKSGKASCAVSNKRPSKNDNKPLLYGRFVKASSQAQESVTQDSDEESDLEKDFSQLCPEEKLFQACGGRTAHKAARHGLRLNGKLQRVEKQDKHGITVDCSSKTDTTECSDSEPKRYVVEETKYCKEKETGKKLRKKDKDGKKKKRKHRDMQGRKEYEVEEESNSCEDDLDEKRAKKTSKKRRDLQGGSGCNVEDEGNSFENDADEKQGKRKKKTNHRDMQRDSDNGHKFEDERSSCDDVADEKRAKKKKRKQRDTHGENEHNDGDECNSCECDVDAKRAKKKKRTSKIKR